MLILKDTYQVRRLKAIENLGGACVVCGECCEMVLEFDHKNDDGHLDKETNSYLIVSKLAFGDGLDRFQLLCANCHRIKTKLHRIFKSFISIERIREVRARFVNKLMKGPLCQVATKNNFSNVLLHPDGTPATPEDPVIIDVDFTTPRRNR
jgi:hypothetical protein